MMHIFWSKMQFSSCRNIYVKNNVAVLAIQLASTTHIETQVVAVYASMHFCVLSHLS